MVVNDVSIGGPSLAPTKLHLEIDRTIPYHKEIYNIDIDGESD